jgi:hypothetical protein
MDDYTSGLLKEPVYENTYITEPEGYGEGAKFQRHKVQEVLRQVIKERIERQHYDPLKGAQITKQMADDLRERVKALGYAVRGLVRGLLEGSAGWNEMQVPSPKGPQASSRGGQGPHLLGLDHLVPSPAGTRGTSWWCR